MTDGERLDGARLPVAKWLPRLDYHEQKRQALGHFADAWTAYLAARAGSDPVTTADALTSVYDRHIGIAAANHYLGAVDRNGDPEWAHADDPDKPHPCADCCTTESPSWWYSRHGDKRWCVVCQFAIEMRELDPCGRCGHRRGSHDTGHCWTCLCDRDDDGQPSELRRAYQHRFVLAKPVVEPALTLFDLVGAA